jgi:aerobic-type carbon monoxide dehydrogenase small subunit (CoxS/CutS family)
MELKTANDKNPTPMELLINGKTYTIQSSPGSMLLDVLREELGLTGSKYGCGEGQCGACTVLVEGRATRSCITPAAAAAGKSITTIEGLEQDGQLHPLQQAFLDADAFQCAYCTSGMIMSGVALLNKNANPSRQEIIRSMEGNVCRCGTYGRIIDAINRAAGNGESPGK